MQIERLIHVNLTCSDLDRSLDFYCRVLGGQVADRSEKQRSDFLEAMGFEGNTAHRAAFIVFKKQPRGPVIDLLEWAEPGPGRPLGMLDVGIPRLAIGVDDIEKAHQELLDEGVEVLGPPRELGVGRFRIRAFLFKDPDGVILEFAEFLKPE